MSIDSCIEKYRINNAQCSSQAYFNSAGLAQTSKA